ncbi:hypothetical protein NPIL_498551, partial [Nephila pilipes]
PESLKLHFQEEEHLLESPYDTNYTDYEDLWNKNNKTGPRSQEICKEWCLSNFLKTCGECYRGFTMIENSRILCGTREPCRGDFENLLKCLMNCKVNCK